MKNITKIKTSMQCKLYEIIWRDQFIIIFLLLFVWPAGVYMMWKKSNWNVIVEVVITLLCVIITILRL